MCVLRAELCNFAPMDNSSSPDETKISFCIFTFSFEVFGENGSTHYASYRTRTAPYNARLCINMTAISAVMPELREHLVKYVNITF